MTNTKTPTQTLRETIISLLDDENGISEQGYCNLREMAIEQTGNECDDIFRMVDASNCRYFLPEDHNLQP